MYCYPLRLHGIDKWLSLSERIYHTDRTTLRQYLIDLIVHLVASLTLRTVVGPLVRCLVGVGDDLLQQINGCFIKWAI